MHVEVPISIAQATLGDKITIPSLKGERGRTASAPWYTRRATFGNRPFIAVRKSLTDKQRELMTQFLAEEKTNRTSASCDSTGFFADTFSRLTNYLKNKKKAT